VTAQVISPTHAIVCFADLLWSILNVVSFQPSNGILMTILCLKDITIIYFSHTLLTLLLVVHVVLVSDVCSWLDQIPAPLLVSECINMYLSLESSSIILQYFQLCTPPNGQRVTLFSLLDLSAAFDCVDHDILVRRLQLSYVIGGSALVWVVSFR